MSDFAKCEKCKKWKTDGKCRACDKAAEEDAQKLLELKEREARKLMEADLQRRKAALARGEELKREGPSHTLEDETSFNWEFDFSLPPIKDIDNIEWKNALGVQRSSSGSEGVWFVSTPQGSVVVCSKSTIAIDMFSSSLSRRFGLNSPRMRCVRQQDEEGKLIYSTLLSLDQKRNVGEHSVQVGLNKTYFQVMEYVQSVELGSLTYEQAVKIFGVMGTLSAAGKQVLHEMGEMIGFDSLINNSDRLPFVWQNNGNAANVLLALDEKNACGRIVVIDSLVSCINPKMHLAGFHAYLEKIKNATKHLCETPHEEYPSIAQAREMIRHETSLSQSSGVGYDVGEGSKIIQSGIVSFMQKCGELSPAELWKMKSDLERMGKDMPGIERLDLDFIHSVLDVFKLQGNVDVKQYPKTQGS
jgi:hypothetical protein